MRLHIIRSGAVLILALTIKPLAPAADYYWTNRAGGNWSIASNWSPNGRPGAADNVFITPAGSCTVTQDVSVSIASLTLGDGIGAPTLTKADFTLTLNGPGVVHSKAVFAMGDGTLAGVGMLAIDGLGLWMGGQIAHVSSVRVAGNGVLEITGSATKSLRGVLANAGTIRLSGGGALAFCAGTLQNMEGGIFELQDDQPIYLSAYCGASIFRNDGTLRKTGGVGTNQFGSVPVANTGIIDVQTGWIRFSSGSSFDTGTQLLGAGANLFADGTVWFNGAIVSSNAVLAGATLQGTNIIYGRLSWTGGDLGNLAQLTVAPEATVEINGPGTTKILRGTLSNQGMVRLAGENALALCNGIVDNLADGVFEMQNDQSVFLWAYCGSSIFHNAGLLRKSRGTATNLFLSVPVINTGTLEAQTGYISYGSGSSFGTGTRFLGAGTNLLERGTLYFDGSIISSNVELAVGATLQGTNTIYGRLWWTGGDLGNLAQVTVAPEAAVEINGQGTTKILRGTLSNHGMVRLAGENALALCNGTVDNLADGVFEMQNDQSVFLWAYCGSSIFHNAGLLRKSGGGATNLFWYIPVINTGVLEAQTGWISFGSGSSFASGTRFLGAGTNLLERGTVYFNGAIVSSNAELAAGVALQGTNALHGVLRWTGGEINASATMSVETDGQLDITGTGTKILRGALSNAGLVRAMGDSALTLCGGTVKNLAGGVFELHDNYLIYLGSYCGAASFQNSGLLRKTAGGGTNRFQSVAVANVGTIDVQSGQLNFDGPFIQTAGRARLQGGDLASSRPLELNGGILSGSGHIFADVHNGAEINPGASCGTLRIHGNYVNTGMLNMEFGGLSPGATHDRLDITGAASLKGILNVRLLPGYRPQPGDAFQAITFGSRNGSFKKVRGLDLGGGKYLTPVWGPTNFTLLTTNGATNLHQMVLVPWEEGSYGLRFTCEPDVMYQLQASIYLTNDWVTLCTTNSAIGVIEIMDAAAPSYPHRFYRAKPWP